MCNHFASRLKYSIFSAAFLLLLLAFPGLANAAVEGQACVAEPTDELIAYSNLRTCTVSPIGDNDIYRFVGALGETVLIRASEGDGNFGSPDVCIDLRRPGGTRFGSVTCGEVAAGVEATLDEAGEWFMLISESGNDQTMNYNLVLERISPPSPTNTPVDSGISLGSEMISPFVDTDLYSFQGSVGDLIRIDASEGDGNFGSPDVCIDLRRPDGSNVLPAVCGEVSAAIETILDQDGEYTIIMSEAGGDQAMNFTLLYTCIVGNCPQPQRAVCDIQLNQQVYLIGDTITTDVWRLANPGPDPLAVEMKAWLEIPGAVPLPIVDLGANSTLVLPPGFDLDLTTVGLVLNIPASGGLPLGNYALSCRLISPVTGADIALDVNQFEIQ